MPHYEFFCRSCKKTFSRILALVDWAEGEITCPHSGSHQVEQVRLLALYIPEVCVK